MKKLRMLFLFCLVFSVFTGINLCLNPNVHAKTYITETLSVLTANGTFEEKCVNIENIAFSNNALSFENFKFDKTKEVNTVNLLFNYINYPNDTTNFLSETEITDSISTFKSVLGDYFNVMSQGKLQVNIDFITLVAPQPYEYYKEKLNSNYTTEHNLFQSAVSNTTKTLAFNSYHVRINVFAGETGDWGTFLWPHAYMSSGLILLVEGKQDSKTLCHELNHTFGADDLYCYEGSSQLFGVGSWDMMGNAPKLTAINAHYRSIMGWFEESDLTDNTQTQIETVYQTTNNLTLHNALTQSPNSAMAYKFGIQGNQFFMAELRIKTESATYDSAIPQTSVVIYRVNTSVSGNRFALSQTAEIVYMGNQSLDVQTSDYINSVGVASGASYGSVKQSTNPNNCLKYSNGNGEINLFSGSNSGIVIEVNSINTENGTASINIIYPTDEEVCMLNASANTYGTITPQNWLLEVSDSLIYSITPSSGHVLSCLTINGEALTQIALAEIRRTGFYEFVATKTGTFNIIATFGKEKTELSITTSSPSLVAEMYFTTVLDNGSNNPTHYGTKLANKTYHNFNFQTTVYVYARLIENTAQYSYKIENNPLVYGSTYLIGSVFINGEQTISFSVDVTKELNSYEVVFEPGDYIEEAFISTSITANTKLTSNSKIEYGQTIYYFAKVYESTAQYFYSIDNATLIADRLYLITQKTIYESTTLNKISARVNLQKYLITWQNGSEVLSQEYFQYGSTPTFNGLTPKKQSTEMYDFIFSGWQPAISPVTTNLTYQANFTHQIRTFFVSFYEENKTTLIKSVEVSYGENAVFDEAVPQKQQNHKESYRFLGWVDINGSSADLTNITENQNVYAFFKAVLHKFNISIIANSSEFGSVSHSILSGIEYGTEISVNNNTITICGTTITATPTPANNNFTYVFKEWSLPSNIITSNTIITAVFLKERTLFSVTLNNENNFFQSFLSIYPNGENPQPSKTSYEFNTTVYYFITLPQNNAQYSYSVSEGTLISGLTYLVGNIQITQNTTLNLSAIQTLNSYVITFKVDNEIISEQSYYYGETATIPSPTKRQTQKTKFVFKHWETNHHTIITNFLVSDNATYHAVFEEFNIITNGIAESAENSPENQLVYISKEDINLLNTTLTINFNNGVRFVFDNALISQLKSYGQHIYVYVNIIDKQTLSEENQKLLTNCKVYEFKIVCGLSALKNVSGLVDISIENANAKSLNVWNILNGEFVKLDNVGYDQNKLTFSTSTLSFYVVGENLSGNNHPDFKLTYLVIIGLVILIIASIIIISKKQNRHKMK